MADPRVKAIRIQTGVVKRLVKEKITYEIEVDQQKERIQKCKDKDDDAAVIKKQEEVLRECMMMVPDCQRRLGTAYGKLKSLLETEAELNTTAEYVAAQKILDEAISQMAVETN